jgi:hypothetical protein
LFRVPAILGEFTVAPVPVILEKMRIGWLRAVQILFLSAEIIFIKKIRVMEGT